MNKKGSHQTVMKELKPAIRWLESLPYVQRVILNRTETARHAYKPGFIRFQMTANGGIKIKGYAGNGIMDIYIKTNQPDTLIEAIKERF